MNTILLLGVYLEIAVLAFFEYRMWKTLYTPLNFLMLPYAVVLLFCVLVCGNFGVTEFYYPSVILWMVGLLLFALPSYFFAMSYNKDILHFHPKIEDGNLSMKWLNILTLLLILLFFLRLFRLIQTSKYLPGSEDFGMEYCGGGLWGHLHRLLHALVIIYIYKYDNKHWYYALMVIAMFVVTFMYGVNSWVIIPAVAGLAMRLYTGKMKLRISLFVNMLIFGFAVFIISYTCSLILGRGDDADSYDLIFDFICRIFIHYFISGIVGWSQDLEMGILERPDSFVILAPVINLFKAFFGGGDYVESLNPNFIHNGINGSNVRSFFGTLFVNTSIFEFIAFVLFLSVLMYSLKIWLMRSKNIYVAIVFFFYAGMFIMGWFDYFFYLLPFLEVPVWVILLYMVFRNIGPTKVDDNKES